MGLSIMMRFALCIVGYVASVAANHWPDVPFHKTSAPGDELTEGEKIVFEQDMVEVDRVRELRDNLNPPDDVLDDAYRYVCKWSDEIVHGGDHCHAIKSSLCDKALNESLVRDDHTSYGAIGSRANLTGVYAHLDVWRYFFNNWPLAVRRGQWEQVAEGCGVVVTGGPHCVRSGDQLWWDFQDIRNFGCAICGRKIWGNECTTSIKLVWRDEIRQP